MKTIEQLAIATERWLYSILHLFFLPPSHAHAPSPSLVPSSPTFVHAVLYYPMYL